MAGMEADSEALPRFKNKSGYLGVKVTSSGKFQPQLFTSTGVPQRGLLAASTRPWRLRGRWRRRKRSAHAEKLCGKRMANAEARADRP